MAEKRAQFLAEAEHAEIAERYDDMVSSVKQLAMLDIDLTVDERNLLSVAYKNVVGTRRAAWRVLTGILHKSQEKEAADWEVEIVKEYRQKVETELEDICRELLDLLENRLLKRPSIDSEGRVFFHKMAGDYNRYLAEFYSDERRGKAAKEAKRQYEQAVEWAKEGNLKPTHPIRLGLALNYSVFFYEILNEPQQACAMAKHAFDDAIGELDSLDEKQYKDSTLIMQLIRDNLTLWTSDTQEEAATNEDGLAVQDIE